MKIVFVVVVVVLFIPFRINLIKFNKVRKREDIKKKKWRKEKNTNIFHLWSSFSQVLFSNYNSISHNNNKQEANHEIHMYKIQRSEIKAKWKKQELNKA